ncbi:MAG: Wzz/FepE/Etk N-terminal domain-containing protein [Pedobacter sp.]|nr:Wzz/FepE/Etk N-terminal domain-containing protein [Pedobacter sp.]MDQ8052878.1 Wzz/FepE/Etk N-terminal domain-containing protein [Pedobacter sp.]
MTTESRQATNKDGEEVSLRELVLKIQEWWRYLLSKWLVILIFGILGAGLGFVYAYFNKTTYTAVTTFVLEEEEKGSGLSSLASMAGIDVGGGGGGIFQGDNIVELYKSRKMIEKTLLSEVVIQGKKQLLIDHFINFNKLREAWAEKPQLKGISFSAADRAPDDQLQPEDLNSSVPRSLNNNTRIKDSIMGVIVDDINTHYLNVGKPDKKLSIIKAEVKSTDEAFAKAFNDQIVKNVNDFYVLTKTKKSLTNVTILQHKTDSVRAGMYGSIYSAAAIADATPNLNPTRQAQRVAPMQRSQFSAEANRIMLGELAKNLEMSKMALLKETPLIQVVDEPIFPLPKERFGKLKGIILGGFLFGFFAALVLIFKKILSFNT